MVWVAISIARLQFLQIMYLVARTIATKPQNVKHVNRAFKSSPITREFVLYG